MDPQGNTFAAFSLIVAPAILTNAALVLAMSTSNRLAPAVDRARDLARQLEAHDVPLAPADSDRTEYERRLDELSATETRTTMLLHVLQSFYFATLEILAAGSSMRLEERVRRPAIPAISRIAS